MRHLARCGLLAGAIGLTALAGVSRAATILHYDFNETGNAPGSDGTNATPVKMRNDAGTALDFHSVDGGGVTGLPGDRSFANTGPSAQGSLASAATNGFRADQPDLAQVDTLTAFTISGWFKTELADVAQIQGATPRLVNNYTGSGATAAGFNLQFLSGSEGDLKIDVDDDSAVVDTSGTGARYSGKQKWVFFAVSYDGALTTNNVNFYIGFRDDTEAGGGPGSANVALVKTVSLNRGAVSTETALLAIGNRPAGDRPFKGFLDEIRVDNVAHAGGAGLAALESYRQAALEAPRDVELRRVSSANVPIASVLNQNAVLVSIPELSGVTYDPSTDRFWAVGDNDGRLVQLDVDFDANGAIVSASAVSAVSLANILDFEGIAFTDAARGSVFLAEENNPGVREYSLASGNLLQALGVPTVFASPNLRANRGFEGVARSPSALEMLTGVEQALTVDGPAGTSATVPTVSRLLRYTVSGNVATEAGQYAYVVEPVHATTAIGDGSSLSDLIILPNGELLTFERSDAASETLVRAFLVSRDGATDVSQGALGSGLIGQTYTPLAKSLLFSDASLGKFEGMTLGPTLGSGGVVLFGVEDAAGTTAVVRSFVLSGDFAGDPCAGSGGDADGDGICTNVDNCPADANPLQENADGDASGDACDTCPNDPANDGDGDGLCADADNCPQIANPLQENADGDASGDVCDICPNDPLNDGDGDGVCADADNCPQIANPLQENADGDASGDVCDICPNDSPDDGDGDGVCTSVDNCPADANPLQENADGDASGDACDTCPNDPANDGDGDGLCADADNCPQIANPLQENADGDASGDVCDVCPNDPLNDADGDGVCADADNCPQIANPLQENADGDANGDACDVCPNDSPDDVDGDGVCTSVDNCPADANPLQENADGDASGNACDVCPNDPANDGDGDGLCADADNCPQIANPLQENADGDASGDVCDACPIDPLNDGDGDGVCADADNCPQIANPLQENTDGDASGDACDACPIDSPDDVDGDGVCTSVDNCPADANPLQENADGDASGNACDVCPNDPANDGDGDGLCADVDNCPQIANPLQENADGDASGDVCDICPNDLANDGDGDGVCAGADNCPLVANPLQENADGDASGDACDTCPNDPANDGDGDGLCADADNCPQIANPLQENADGDASGDACDTCPNDPANDGDGDGLCADADNCPQIANPLQENADGDASGDVCDVCPNDSPDDVDGDGVCTSIDNCPQIANPAQENTDGDASGNVCDVCPNDPANDADGDAVCADADNCPTVPNPGQEDGAAGLEITLAGLFLPDGVGDACDNCVRVNNPRPVAGYLDTNPWRTLTGGQIDDDHDGYGNRCDAKFVGAPSQSVGGLDLGQFRASNNEDRTEDTCGANNTRPCAIFDLDEAAAGDAIGGLDLGRFRQLNNATPGPRCEACTGTDSVPLPCTAGTAGACEP